MGAPTRRKNGKPEDPEENLKNEDPDNTPPKADVVHRFIARFIDLLIAGGLAQFLFPVGYLAGLTYLLIADGFAGGQSFGKKLIGLQTIVHENHVPATYRESILRNIPCAGAFLCFLIPFIGWVLGAGILIFEGLLIIGNDEGIRLGDEIAQTRVIEGIPASKEPAILKPEEAVNA